MSDHFGTLYNERWKKKEGIYYTSKWSGDKLECFKNDTVEFNSIICIYTFCYTTIYFIEQYTVFKSALNPFPC